ncbi:MAG: acyl-CoA dehydrogenase [Pseudomonadota bacterium]
MYTAPVVDITHTLKQATRLGEDLSAGRMGELSADLLDAIVEEAGKFSSEEVASLLRVGEEHGTPLKDGVVTMPPGWKEIYNQWVEAGWNALTGPEEFGGQGLTTSLSVAAFEMWNSGSLSFGIGPTLTVGAVEALEKHGSDELKATYLAKLVSGEWMGTMNLTEPQAGSDLNALRARAERRDDGTYRVFGQKIFITYGEHDLTDNIIHLVLARLPDAPAGTRGISLFLVPKFLVNEDGSLGARNDLFCSGVEEKLGIHGSPTCTMIYGDGYAGDEPGAIGYLVGEENRGLACMFTMMNNARLLVGIQGVAAAEAAYQHALSYAQERKQGRAIGQTSEGMAAIVEHPDVQRNLATMKALTAATRAICYDCAHALDLARLDEDKAFWANRANLLTPIAKAFSTDVGVEVASIGVQIHGGMGFIEETGAAQFLRDARIAPIYEGTNGIQAIDLVSRKLPLEGSEVVRAYLAELSETIDRVAVSNRSPLQEQAENLRAALTDLTEATDWILASLEAGETNAVLCGATPYLRLFGLASGGVYLARLALAAECHREEDRTAVLSFFAENILSETSALLKIVTKGADSLNALGNILKN